MARFAGPVPTMLKSERLSWPLLPPSYERQHGHAERVELAADRRIRERNKINYRLAHWPIWIFVFFIAPGPLTFDLFDRGFDARMWLWLAAVLIGTGIAGLCGALPGVEPRPYIIRFTEDRPNPLYRRVCYTLAWSEVIAFGVLNIAGLATAIFTGEWRLRQMYDQAYFPIAGTIWILGALGLAAARQGLDPGRRARAALLLRLGVGGRDRAADPVGDVEGAAAGALGRCRQARRLRRHPRLRRQPGPTRPPAAHASDRPRGARGLGLSALDSRRPQPRGDAIALSTNASMSFAGRAPAVRPISFPSANTAIVGIERMPQRSPRSVSTSVFTLTTT